MNANHIIGGKWMQRFTTNMALQDSLRSTKKTEIKKEDLPKEILHKIKLIEKAFRWKTEIHIPRKYAPFGLTSNEIRHKMQIRCNSFHFWKNFAQKAIQQVGYWRFVMKKLSIEEIEMILTQIISKPFDTDNKDVSEEDVYGVWTPRIQKKV